MTSPYLHWKCCWSKTFFRDDWVSGLSGQQTSDGRYIVLCESGDELYNETNIYLLKTDGNGIEQWNQIFTEVFLFGTNSDLVGNSVKQTSDGGYIISGASEDYGGVLIKTDANGNVN